MWFPLDRLSQRCVDNSENITSYRQKRRVCVCSECVLRGPGQDLTPRNKTSPTMCIKSNIIRKEDSFWCNIDSQLIKPPRTNYKHNHLHLVQSDETLWPHLQLKSRFYFLSQRNILFIISKSYNLTYLAAISCRAEFKNLKAVNPHIRSQACPPRSRLDLS